MTTDEEYRAIRALACREYENNLSIQGSQQSLALNSEGDRDRGSSIILTATDLQIGKMGRYALISKFINLKLIQ